MQAAKHQPSIKARLIEDWKILPMEGGDVCVKGTYQGKEWITTPIVRAKKVGQERFVETQSGTIYKLGVEQSGMWLMALQVKRLEKFNRLQDLGIL